jgi:hypothetical protein
MEHFQIEQLRRAYSVVPGLEAILQDPFDLPPAIPGGSISGTVIGNDHPFGSGRRRVTCHLQSVQLWQRSVLSLQAEGFSTFFRPWNMPPLLTASFQWSYAWR